MRGKHRRSSLAECLLCLFILRSVLNMFFKTVQPTKWPLRCPSFAFFEVLVDFVHQLQSTAADQPWST